MLGTYMPEKRFDMVAVGKVGWQKGGVRGQREKETARGAGCNEKSSSLSLVIAVRVEGVVFC